MKTPIKGRRRRGFALMLVMIEVALIAGLWGIAHRQLVATMRFLAAMNQQAQAAGLRQADGFKPLARALSLLETGDPTYQGQPVDVFTCNVTVLTGSGPAYFTVTYQKQAQVAGSDGETWAVSSTRHQVSDGEMAGWNANLMPSSFAN